MMDREPTDAEVEEVASELRLIAHSSQWDKVLAIGRLILCRFFDGNERAWRERRRNKDRSIRRLAERPDCPFAKSALNEAVGVHVLCSKYPEARSEGITPTHVGRTLGLEPQVAIALLRQAGREGWSVRQIAGEAAQIRRAWGERRGRPVSGAEQKAAGWGRRALAALVQMGTELTAAWPIDPARREPLDAMCRSIEEQLLVVRNVLLTSTSDRLRTATPARASRPYALSERTRIAR